MSTVCLSLCPDVCVFFPQSLLHGEFPNLQMELCAGFCSPLQYKSIPQRTQTPKWNQFQIANAGCHYRSVARRDKAIYGEDRRWERLAFSPHLSLSEILRLPFYLETNLRTQTYRPLGEHIQAPSVSSQHKFHPFLLAIHSFSFYSH